ncbi:MAG: aminotransferase class III-fold pyridoxal phosphate-dependent enzyme, partial [Myxococcota bacterium]|nr:aminotransferase class III-fold pyridoxal phosphate-dependent enzyme [Myxococcota bacterium]
ALGGGLIPVSACLLSERAYSKDFALKHSSTFGGHALAMRIGLAVVERLTSPDQGTLDNVIRQGSYLKHGLRAVQRRHSSVIREVRGRGLMIGVELGADPSMIERGVGSLMTLLGDGLAPFAASYLLNVARLRVAPTLNGSSVLRVQPALTVTREECDWIIGAFEQLGAVMSSGRSDQLVSHVLESRDVWPASTEHSSGAVRATVANSEQADGHFAFIVHMLDGQSLVDFDRSLARLPASSLNELAVRFEDSVKPFACSRVRIQSPDGRAAIGDFISLPKTAAQLLRLSPEEAQRDVAAAVQLCKDRGAKIVGLGGYTSVVAQNLRGLLKLGVPLTTGNSYTVVSAIDAAVEAARLTGRKLEKSRAVIVGGGGSIGSALASLLAERVASLVLVSRESDSAAMRSRYAVIVARMIRHLARRRLQGSRFPGGSLAYQLSTLSCGEDLAQGDGRMRLTESAERLVLQQAEDLPIRWTTDLASAVGQADLLFLATSSPEELIKSHMVQSGTIICDLSRPANVGDDLFERDDVLVIDGGIVEIPGRPSLGFNFGLASGLAYACMAETMLLGLERRYENTSLGRDLQEGTLDLLRSLASKHGFRLAQLRSRQRPIDISAWSSRSTSRVPHLRRVSV